MRRTWPPRRPRDGAAPSAPPRPSAADLAATTVAALIALTLLAAASAAGWGLFVLPFAASAAVVAMAPATPLAQPRSIVAGHLSAAVVALALTAVTGPSVWAGAIAAGLAVAPVLHLRAPHPPAVATAALVGLTGPDPLFLLIPVLAASAVVIAVGVLAGLALPGRRYPSYWW